MVENSIKDQFLDLMLDSASKVNIGDPLNPATTMGPIVSAQQADKIAGYIMKGIEESANLKFGGN